MDVDTSVTWRIANPEAIQVDDTGTVWNAGCIRDVVITGSGEIIAASDTGGIWSVTEAGTGTSLTDWDKPNLWCLARGPNGDQHLYAGGDALYETDMTSAVPLLSWRQVPLQDSAGDGIGTVFRIAALWNSRNLVLATSSGVYWSSIPTVTESGGCLSALLSGPSSNPGTYSFQKVKNIPDGAYLGLAEGPNDTIAVAYWGNDALRADLYYGGWQQGTLVLQQSSIDDESARLVMFATTLASCANDRKRMYAVSSDSDGFVSFVLKSVDGGATWTSSVPQLDDPSQTFHDVAGNQGNDGGRPCNSIAVAPHDPEKVVIGWRNAGILILTGDANGLWHLAENTSPHLHSDLHTVYFDPADGDGNTVYIGGDGGLVVTRDLGNTYDSSFNHHLLNLQFQSWPAREFYGTFCPSPQVSGLIAGGLQDNGNVSCIVWPTTSPWQRFGRVDDGMLTQFVQTGHALYYFNDDNQTQDVAWDQSGNPNNQTYVPLWTASGPEAGPPSAIAEPVRVPTWANSSGQLMYAVAVLNTVVYGFFSAADGSGNHWEQLADFGVDVASLNAVGSATGSSVYVGTSDGRLFQLDTTSRVATEWGVGLTTAAAGGGIYKIVAVTDDTVFATYNVNSNGYILQKLPTGFGQMTNGLPDSDPFYGLEAIQGDNQPALFAASDSLIYVTRDNGNSWQNASTGLPVRPHCCDIRYVEQQDGNGFLYLSTFGRSVWVYQALFRISITPR